jgi:hypothetical protein
MQVQFKQVQRMLGEQAVQVEAVQPDHEAVEELRGRITKAVVAAADQTQAEQVELAVQV